tara:strand:+ start:6592 stop:6915 length:324 start_codon:yes stop_codon:yes gene_type:complete
MMGFRDYTAGEYRGTVDSSGDWNFYSGNTTGDITALSTDAGAAEGPTITGAPADLLGSLIFLADAGNGLSNTFLKIAAMIDDPGATTEDAHFTISQQVASRSGSGTF